MEKAVNIILKISGVLTLVALALYWIGRVDISKFGATVYMLITAFVCLFGEYKCKVK
jgi:hypothetical protein